MMNEAVVLSIRPIWVHEIRRGNKTVEVRKTFPGLTPLPFKVYIYETAFHGGKGAVVGEFVCDEIYDIEWNGYGYNKPYDESADCLSVFGMHDYLGPHNGYGWHISDLKIYDKPIPIFEFVHIYCSNGMENVRKAFTKPPQSWAYCEIRK